MDSFEAFSSVFLGADEVIAAFVNDNAQGWLFVVERIGGDECVLEVNRRMGEQGAGFTDFAVFFFAGGGDHGDWPSVFVAAIEAKRRWTGAKRIKG